MALVTVCEQGSRSLRRGDVQQIKCLLDSLYVEFDDNSFLRDGEHLRLLKERKISRCFETTWCIPKSVADDLIPLSSQSNGNCLYSAASVFLVGSSILVDNLRVMVCLELFLNSEFYFSHPIFEYVYNFNKDLFSCSKTVLFLALSNNTTDQEISDDKLLQSEAVAMCKDKCWSSFVCVLALSTVLKRRINLLYPDFGPVKYRALFNNLILPRHFYQDDNFILCDNSVINLLFCNSTRSENSDQFSANHFISLIHRLDKPREAISTLKRSISLIDKCPKKKTKSNDSKSASVFMKNNIFHYFKNAEPNSSSSHSVSSLNSVQVSTSSNCSSGSKVLNQLSNVTTPAVTSPSVVTSTSSVLTSSVNSIITTSSSNVSTSYTTSINTATSTPLSSVISIQLVSSSKIKSVNELLSPKVLDKPDPKLLDNAASKTDISYSSIPLKDRYDVGFYYTMSKKLSDKEKYDLIKNCHAPNKTFSFPKGKPPQRPFLITWLEEYQWLRYSKHFNGGFCLPCTLFAHNVPNFQHKVLISKAVCATKNSKLCFKRHLSPNGLHEQCLRDQQSFLLRFEGKVLPINTLINKAKVEGVRKAKLILPSIIDTVILCGHLGIPLRGHRDDRRFFPDAGQYAVTAGVGNFVELLNFAIRRGDGSLKEHYEHHPGNASYFSKTSQNEFINICGSIIIEKIILSLKPTPSSSYFFSVIADEAMDSSQKEQLSLVLRYLDSSYNILEEFTGFIHLEGGLTGKAISDSILEKVSDLGLDIMQCRGQGYDGAGAVSGVKNGASAHILRVNKKALYTHCFNHRLNLAVSKNFKVISISNMMETVQKISYFFQFSEQRQLCFEKHVDQFCPSSTAKKLRDPCKTRWVERILDLDLFIELFEPLWSTLEEMKINSSGKHNRKTQTDAFSFFKAIDNFDFILNLLIGYRVLELSLLVTQLLQSKKNDIADGIHMITSLINQVCTIRQNVESYHSEWYNEALVIASRLNIVPSKPRTNKRQIFRDNHPADSISDFYRVSLTIPLVDTLKEELKSRFSNNALVAYTGLYLIPSKIVSMESTQIEPLRKLCHSFFTFYFDDMPDPIRIGAELDVWEKHWRSEKRYTPSNFSDTLKHVDFTAYDNIKVALRILATLPITSCECERSFSGMKRVKTALSSNMGQDRLNGLSLLNFHLDKVPDTHTVCDKFLAIKDRMIDR